MLRPGPPRTPQNRPDMAGIGGPDPPGNARRSWEIVGFRCRGGGPTWAPSRCPSQNGQTANSKYKIPPSPSPYKRVSGLFCGGPDIECHGFIVSRCSLNTPNTKQHQNSNRIENSTLAELSKSSLAKSKMTFPPPSAPRFRN